MKLLRAYLILLIVLFLYSPISQAQHSRQNKLNKGKQAQFEKVYQQANFLYQEQKYQEALKLYKKTVRLIGIHPDDKAFVLYRSACCYAFMNKTTNTFHYLRQAVKSGFDDPELLDSNPAFSSIKEEKRFIRICENLTPSDIKNKSSIKVEKTKVINKSPGGDPWENAYELQTDHYIIHIDIPEEDAIKVAQNLEYLLEVMCRVFKLDIKRWGNKKNCFLFKDIEKFRQVRDKLNVFTSAVHGYVAGSDLYCFVRGRGYGGLYWTYLHEGCHLVFGSLVGMNSSGSDFWVVEGIACYMGSLKMELDGSFVFGQENHTMLKQFYQRNGDKVAQMVSWDRNTLYSQPNRGGYYIIGYGVCHYLFNIEQGRYKKRFGEYVRLIHQSRGKKNTFEETIGFSLGELQERVKEYVKQLD